jgi:hypothetical protein
MSHLLHRRPSAALLVAIIALVVATSGTAVAASSLVSGDTLIKKNSLSGNRLRNHSVPGSKIQLSTLGTVPNASRAAFATTAASATSATSATTATTAANATNATTATNASNATTAGSAPIAKVTYAAMTVGIPANSGPVLVTATCPAGTTVTGGGVSISDEVDGGFVNDSYPNGKTAWSADIFGGGVAMNSTVTAICAPAAATAP